MFKGFYSSDTNVKLALTGLLLKGTVTNFFLVLSMKSAASAVFPIAILLFLIGFKDLFLKIGGFIVTSTLAMIAIWGLTILFFPMNLTYIKEEWSQSFINCFPFMWLGYYFIKKGVYLDYFLPIARVKLIIALLVQVIILVNPSKDIWNNDYMTAANEMLVGLIAVNYLYIRERKNLDLFLVVTGTLLMLTVGSRGGVMSILFFWGCWWIMAKRNIMKNVVYIMLFGIFLLLSGPIMNTIFSMSKVFGYSSHIEDTIEGGGLFTDKARMSLFTFFIDKIKESPFGYGVMGDRFLTDGFYFKPIYPHNLYIEILTNFGFVTGGIISLILTFYLVKYLFGYENKNYSMAILILCSISFVHLMFSGSYWGNHMFYMLIGLMIGSRCLKTSPQP